MLFRDNIFNKGKDPEDEKRTERTHEVRQSVRFVALKGINALISSVLLIATVIILAVIVMNFSTTLIKKEARVVENRSTACINHDVSIEEVYLDISSSVARVAVRNSGFVADEIVSAVLLNKKGEIAANTTRLPLSLAKGALSNIVFNISGKISECGNFSKVIISTECASDETDAEPRCIGNITS